MSKKSTAVKDFKGWLRSLELGLVLAGLFVTVSVHWRGN